MNKPISHQRIALERIDKLFFQADSNFKERPELSKRYVEMARRLSTKYKVKFTTEQKRMSCKKCNAYLKNGVNSRVRLEHGKLVQTCLECKHVRRIPYKK